MSAPSPRIAAIADPIQRYDAETLDQRSAIGLAANH